MITVMSWCQGLASGNEQAAVIRDAILDALADRLDHDDPDDIAMPQVAADAGVSLRTLYRYFPTREAMFDAVAITWSRASGCRARSRARTISRRVFLESARRGAQSPQLVRAMLWTRLGRRARSPHRRRRVESITAALAEVTSHLPPMRHAGGRARSSTCAACRPGSRSARNAGSVRGRRPASVSPGPSTRWSPRSGRKTSWPAGRHAQPKGRTLAMTDTVPCHRPVHHGRNRRGLLVLRLADGHPGRRSPASR